MRRSRSQCRCPPDSESQPRAAAGGRKNRQYGTRTTGPPQHTHTTWERREHGEVPYPVSQQTASRRERVHGERRGGGTHHGRARPRRRWGWRRGRRGPRRGWAAGGAGRRPLRAGLAGDRSLVLLRCGGVMDFVLSLVACGSGKWGGGRVLISD